METTEGFRNIIQVKRIIYTRSSGRWVECDLDGDTIQTSMNWVTDKTMIKKLDQMMALEKL